MNFARRLLMILVQHHLQSALHHTCAVGDRSTVYGACRFVGPPARGRRSGHFVPWGVPALLPASTRRLHPPGRAPRHDLIAAHQHLGTRGSRSSRHLEALSESRSGESSRTVFTFFFDFFLFYCHIIFLIFISFFW